jgi:hypothetical protein
MPILDGKFRDVFLPIYSWFGKVYHILLIGVIPERGDNLVTELLTQSRLGKTLPISFWLILSIQELI